MGDGSKCNVTREAIRTSRCDIVALQETKWNELNLSYVMRSIPSYFDRNVVYINARGGRGEDCILAWRTLHSTPLGPRNTLARLYLLIQEHTSDLQSQMYMARRVINTSVLSLKNSEPRNDTYMIHGCLLMILF
jgi:hypothetical protein